MGFTVVYFPDHLLQLSTAGYIFGFRDFINENNNFYVCDVIPEQQLSSRHTRNIIGYYSHEGSSSSAKKSNWIVIDNQCEGVHLLEASIDGKSLDLRLCRLIEYNFRSFLRSELLIGEDFTLEEEFDVFKRLTYYVQLSALETHRSDGWPKKSFDFCFRSLVEIFKFLILIFDKIPFLTVTSFGKHLKNYVVYLKWALQYYLQNHKLNLKTGNYVCSLAIDMLLGTIVLSYVIKSMDEVEMLINMVAIFKDFISWITEVIEQLMGSPAGLKLNDPLNQVIGGFFLYNISLWWTFLGIIGPILKYGFYVFLKFGFLGFTFQVAIITDIFILVTFHVNCIYIYAARLYAVQVHGLWSLSKLVIGKKRNPVPGRIDSCPYTTEQLFAGTISFTFLLFLLPTVMVYYIVFMSMRLAFFAFCCIMARVKYYLQILPVYITFLWCFQPSSTALTVELRSSNKINGISWKAEAKSVSWMSTVRSCIPEEITVPAPIPWKTIISNITTGSLIRLL